jgi:hypothetical protein
VPRRKRTLSLSIHDPHVPTEVKHTLSRLLGLGYNRADTAYIIETSVLNANQLSFTDLRTVLRARRAARRDAFGVPLGKQSPILQAVGHDKTHTMFWLRVDLIA